MGTPKRYFMLSGDGLGANTEQRAESRNGFHVFVASVRFVKNNFPAMEILPCGGLANGTTVNDKRKWNILMKKFKFLMIASSLAILAGCMEPAPDLTPEQAAEIEQARADAVAAECALYEGTGITPEGCEA